MKRPPAVNELLEQLQRMPGIGQKTAERLSFFLMRGGAEQAYKLADVYRMSYVCGRVPSYGVLEFYLQSNVHSCQLY